MSLNRTIEDFLRTQVRLEREAASRTAAQRHLPFVTVSRQAGSGAERYCEALLAAVAALGSDDAFQDWQVFDRAVIERASGDPELKRSLEALLAEGYHSQVGEFVLGIFGRYDSQDAHVIRLSKAIRSLANVGKMIIIGHGAALVTRQAPCGVRVRLVAPDEARLQNLMRRFEIDERAARNMMHERDEERGRLLRVHFKANIDDPLLYDLVCNTAQVTPAELARAVAAIVADRYRGQLPV